MMGNYFKTALRSLKRNKGFTFLNITGLTIGLAVYLLIIFYVVDETSYDRYNSNGDRIYRVNTDTKINAAGVGALLIAGVTISGQFIKAAVANPVQSLKNE